MRSCSDILSVKKIKNCVVKAASFDDIYPEFLGPNALKWLLLFYNII